MLTYGALALGAKCVYIYISSRSGLLCFFCSVFDQYNFSMSWSALIKWLLDGVIGVEILRSKP